MARVQIDYPERTLFTCDSAVRITDLSAAMHLGFDSLVGIVNDASARFFRQIGVSRGSFSGINTIFSDLAVSYRSEAFHEDRLTIEVAAGDVNENRLELVFRVSSDDDGREVALARIGVLFFDYAKRKVVKIPDEVRRRLNETEIPV